MIELDNSDGVAWLSFNRPGAERANSELTSALEAALDDVAARENTTVLVVSGRAFSAGRLRVIRAFAASRL